MFDARPCRFATLAAAAVLFVPVTGASQTVPTQREEPADVPKTAEREPVLIGTTLETYYQFNWNRPSDRMVRLRAYDTRANTFSLQQVALVVDAPPDVDAHRRYGVRVDLQFGQATETVQGSPANEPRPDVYRHVWQAFGSYVFPIAPHGLQMNAGKFASNLGYETNYAKDNQAFSRALLFNFLPFYHTGLRLTSPIHSRVTVSYMLTNGIQQTEEFNDFKSHQVSLTVKPLRGVSWIANYYAGREQPDGGEVGGPDGRFTVFDTYATVTPASGTTFGVDVNHTTNRRLQTDPRMSLTGLGLYGRYQLTYPFGLGVRYERLADEGLFGGSAQTLFELTLTAEYRFADGFLVRAEYRRDSSSEAFFPGAGGSDDLRRVQPTALVGAIWVLGTKKGTW
jgi:hypothetical protein